MREVNGWIVDWKGLYDVFPQYVPRTYRIVYKHNLQDLDKAKSCINIKKVIKSKF